MGFERWVYTMPLRLRSLFRRRQVELELAEELRYHLERQIEDHVARGLTPEEARLTALRAMGGVEQRKEECRDLRRVNLMESLVRDAGYGWRLLRRSPGFASVAVLSLTLGIGANAAIFQLLNAVRLRSLPIADPQELTEVKVAGGNLGMGVQPGVNSEITYPLWERIRQHQQAFSGIFAWGNASFDLGQGRDTRRVSGLWVSGDLFQVLGVRPLRGRLFTAADDRRGSGLDGTVISYAFWQRYFGGDESAIGRTLILKDRPFTVIGITPPEFFGLEIGKSFDVAVPVCERARDLDRLDLWWLVVMGRLKPDWTLAQAAEHLRAMSPGIFAETVPPGYDAGNDEVYRNFRLTAAPAGGGVSQLRTRYETSLWLLLGITGMVLLIACANIANLMLARANARAREIAVRVVLGASRGRLIRQMLSESLLLAGLGTLLGAGLARLIGRNLVSFLTTEGNLLYLDLSPDWRILVFTGSIAVLTCVAFGLIPALKASQLDPGTAIRSGGRGLTSNRERFSFQRLLVVSQIAFSLVLLVGALLFVRSFWNLATLDPGFRQRGILRADLDFPRLRLPADRILPFQASLLERIRSIPQVEAAASSSVTPMTGGGWTQGVRVPGPQSEQWGSPKFSYVSPEYFKTMEIPLLAGRDFNDYDTANSRKVAVVNEAFVRRLIGSGDPVGTRFRSLAEPGYPETLYEVIGVVKDTTYSSLRAEMPPITYIPAAQHPAYGPWLGVLIRSSAPLSGVQAAVRRQIDDLNPEIQVRFRVLETQIHESLIRERLMAWLAGFFGLLATVLAMIGLYGVISYMVLRRRNEIGLRLALGATRPQIVLIVLREVTGLLSIGLGVGTAVSLAAAGGARALLFSLTPYDLPTLAISAGVLAVVAGIAGLVPALRASRVDPIVALRHD